MKRITALVLATALLGAALPVAAPDGELALTCLKRHQPIVDANAVAVSTKDHAKSWGVCITYVAKTQSKSWWRKKAADWIYVGLKPAGVPARDVSALATALAKAAANVKL